MGQACSLSPPSLLPGPLGVIPFPHCLYHLAVGWWYSPLSLFLRLPVVPAPCIHHASSCSQWWGVLVDVGARRAGGSCRIVGGIGAHTGLSSCFPRSGVGVGSAMLVGALSFEALVVAKVPVIHPTSSCSSASAWTVFTVCTRDP